MDTEKQPRMASIALGALIVLFTALYAGFSLFRHGHFGSYEDLAMFDQMLWNLRQGRGLITTLSGNPHLVMSHHFFSEHVSPILYLLAWPAGLTSGPEALLFLQAWALALSAWPAARIVETRLHSPWAGVGAALLWLALPGLWGAVIYDFHMEALEAVFLFAFWLALMKGRRSTWLWAVLYVLCKEDAPICLAVAAAAGGWMFRQKRLGFMIAAACGLYAVAAIGWIGPAFSESGATLVQARLLTPAGVGGLIPWIKTVAFNASRWSAIGRHMLGFGGLPLLGGLALLPGLAAVGIAWLSSAPAQYTLFLHYPLTVYPLVFLAAVEGARRVQSYVPRLFTPVNFPLPARPVFAAGILLAGLAGAWLSHGPRMVEDLILPVYDIRHVGVQEARTLLRRIPPHGSLAVSLTLAPHVARRQDLTLLLNPTHADWVAMRMDNNSHPMSNAKYHGWIGHLLQPESGYGVVSPPHPFLVIFQRGGAQDQNPRVKHQYEERLLILEAEGLGHECGRRVDDPTASNEHAWRVDSGDIDAAIICGGYLNLPAGAYRVTFRIRPDSDEPDPVARLEVVTGQGAQIYGMAWVSGRALTYQDVTLEVNLPGSDTTEFRAFKIGHGGAEIDTVAWTRLPDAPP